MYESVNRCDSVLKGLIVLIQIGFRSCGHVDHGRLIDRRSWDKVCDGRLIDWRNCGCTAVYRNTIEIARLGAPFLTGAPLLSLTHYLLP